jgi:urease accessory protein UreF
MIVKPDELTLTDAAEWLGDWHPLAEQLGSTDGLIALGSVSSLLHLQPVQDAATLLAFLRQYQKEILVTLELPVIQSAWEFANTHALRELVALDQKLTAEPALADFASASCRVGQFQLRKLRPLRDDRMVQRYLRAVDGGQARGWHTLVYGLTIAVYSLPLRQGLMGYAHQPTRGFIYSAVRPLQLSELDCRQLFDDLCVGLPAAVEGLVKPMAPVGCA